LLNKNMQKVFYHVEQGITIVELFLISKNNNLNNHKNCF